MDNSIYRKEVWEMTDNTGPELADTENRKSLSHSWQGEGWAQRSTQVGRKTPYSVIYSMGQTEPMPPSLTTPPRVVEIKVPGSFSRGAERKVLWNVGIPATQLPWLGAHKLSKPPGSARGLLHLLTRGS